MSETVFVDQLTELMKKEIRQELAFTNTEYQSRVNKIKLMMQDRGIDLLLSTYLPNICYITGYQFTNCDYSGYLLLPRNGTTTMVVPGTEVSTVLLHGWVRDVLDFPSWKPHEAAPLIANIIKKLGYDSGNIGIEQRFELMDPLILEQIQALLPNINIVDVSDLVIDLRAVKSSTEIDHLRQAARYSDLGMLAAMSKIAVGATENDIAAAAVEDMIRVGSEFFSTAPTIATGVRTSVPNAMFKRHKIETGDAIEIQLAGTYQRYSTPLVRTFIAGTPSHQQKELIKLCMECREVLLESVKPGVRIGDAASKVVTMLGESSTSFWPCSQFGYSIGVGMPPSWVEEWLEIRVDNDRIFEPGMVFHSLMSLRVPGETGITIGDSWLVTDNGIEILSKLSPKVIDLNGSIN